MGDKNIWSYSFTASIWKILYDPFTDLLITELRSEANAFSLAAIPVVEKKLVWEKHFSFTNATAVASAQGKIVVQTYKNTGYPEPAEIILINVLTGEIVRVFSGYSYKGMGEKGLFLQKWPGNDFILIKSETGLYTEVNAGEVSFSESSEWPKYPFEYLQQEQYFEQVKVFLKSLGKTPVKQIQYLQHKKLVVIGYSEESTGKLNSYLLIMKESGELVGEYKLASDLQNTGSGSFFMVKDLLVFVRDKKEIVILNVNF